MENVAAQKSKYENRQRIIKQRLWMEQAIFRTHIKLYCLLMLAHSQGHCSTLWSFRTHIVEIRNPLSQNKDLKAETTDPN